MGLGWVGLGWVLGWVKYGKLWVALAGLGWLVAYDIASADKAPVELNGQVGHGGLDMIEGQDLLLV